MSEPDEKSESGIQPADSTERAQLRGVGILAVCWMIIPALSGFYLVFWKLGWASDQLVAMGGAAIVVYIVLFAVSSGLGLLPTYAQAILGGWVFGAGLGTVGAVAGIVLGALIGFLIAHIVSGKGIELFIERRPQVVAVRDSLVGQGWIRTTLIVGLLRLSPNSPFALMNLGMGAARTPVVPYLLGTGLGVLPRTAIAATIAAAAASDGSRDIVEVVRSRGLSMTILGLGLLIVAIVIVSAIGKHALKKVTQVPSRTNSEDASI